MASQILGLEEDVKAGIIVGNPDHAGDQKRIESFIVLKGGSARPIDTVVHPRSRTDFALVREKLPKEFFEPFNTLLDLVGWKPLQIEPDLDIVASWNKPMYADELVVLVEHLLSAGGCPLLVPTLVDVFRNLEWERAPIQEEWTTITAIAIPGSRTYDRVPEAFRAYRMCRGNAVLITLGRAPYFDPDNSFISLTESEANSSYLRLLGVPADRIYAEDRSQDTFENAEFLGDVLDRDMRHRNIDRHNLLLITSPFHLTRYRLNVQFMLDERGNNAAVFALGSRASHQYWAETYFLDDPAAPLPRSRRMRMIFNEYLKVAFDVCATKRSPEEKAVAYRT